MSHALTDSVVDRHVVEPPEAFAFWQVHDTYAPAADADFAAQHFSAPAETLHSETGDIPAVATFDAPHRQLFPSEKQWPGPPDDDDDDAPEDELEDELDPDDPDDDELDPDDPDDEEPSPDAHAINEMPNTPATNSERL